MSVTDEILLERQGGLGIVTLNRPKALNTLSLAMYRVFDPQLIRWGADPAVEAVLVRGAGDRAFCAGGDVRAIYDARAESAGTGDYKADFFREEYRLIERVHRLPKPYVALVDGIAMGGGCGVSINGSHRVVSERAVFAMPEVHIGLFPDVGASRFLNLCPGRVGLYLALTGTRIRAADALYCGFATHYVPHDRLAALTVALAALGGNGDRRRAVDAAIANFAGDAGEPPLATLQGEIDRCFGGGSVEEIVGALRRERAPWAQAALGAIERASPLSLKITFRQLQLGRGMDIEAALALEYCLTQHVMAGHDFYEGIRALLVEKDNAPRWQHASLEEVSAAEVEGYFMSLGERELRFG
ncbi:MAG TPA: enoyl-CoA hydratase/isomerase family protein [Stellaceae bacterium]|nr:enoyl-CoA hydratase/isomerase family protein [Stellaceae bacterium]